MPDDHHNSHPGQEPAANHSALNKAPGPFDLAHRVDKLPGGKNGILRPPPVAVVGVVGKLQRQGPNWGAGPRFNIDVQETCKQHSRGDLRASATTGERIHTHLASTAFGEHMRG